jgi:hypothetical protein
MRLYPDQTLPVDLAALLRSAGHDVLRPAEVGQPSVDDAEILNRAIDTTDRLEGRYLRRCVLQAYGITKDEWRQCKMRRYKSAW